MRERQDTAAGGTVIDGEAVAVREYTVQATHVLAHQTRGAPSPPDRALPPQDAPKAP
jgi:hypothetical protein